MFLTIYMEYTLELKLKENKSIIYIKTILPNALSAQKI